MLKNYFKILIRNTRKNPLYMFINVFGLAVGMAVSILIFLFVQHELSYDKYHANQFTFGAYRTAFWAIDQV